MLEAGGAWAGGGADLWASARFSFPWSAGGCGAKPCSDVSYDEERYLRLPAPARGAKALAWRLRYLHAVPFEFKGTTWFWLSTVDFAESSPEEAVVRITPHHDIETACVFRFVEDDL